MIATTSLKKISALKKKIRVIQGGQGSSKTYSILTILINHAASKSDKKILILSAELTKMRLTVIDDFVKIMKSFGIYEQSNFKGGTLYRFSNGSFIKFIGLDKDDVGKGLRCDVAFFNEVNKIDKESYRQVASRAKAIYCDFNPDANFFIHEDVVGRDDCDYITLTYKDNEALSTEEVHEIEMYKKLGYDEKGNIINKYWANKWRVYGLGQVGMIDGVVFEKWEVTDEVPKEARLLYYGCDFGFSISKLAIVSIWKWNGSYVIHEEMYDNKLTNQEAANQFKNYKKGYVVYCDSTEPKSIRELTVAGINAVPCDSKRDIKPYAIQKLNTVDFYVTKSSDNLQKELRAYVYDEKTGKPKKSDLDHLIDAMLYSIGSGDKYNGKYL